MRTKYSKRNVINVITLGCSKNIFDSEVLMGQLKANDKNVVHQERGNIVVINTCGFIDNAKEESVNTILEQIQFKKEGFVVDHFFCIPLELQVLESEQQQQKLPYNYQ